MPQSFQVLRCYKCLAFQVHQTKKSNKFACKICDEKQSIKRHYGIGIAKDCRMHVQKLNKMRGERDETRLEDVNNECEEEYISNGTEDTTDTTDNFNKTSKWLSYIDNQIGDTDNDEKEIISETNHKNNKRWLRNNKLEKCKEKKKIALKDKHCNDIEEKQQDSNESIIDNNNTKNMFGKRLLYESQDTCRVVNKVSKLITQDMTLPRNNCKLKDNNLTSINKIPKLESPKLNQPSKWAQFIDNEENIGEENCYDEADENLPKNIQPLFSLCDDSDIDDVLNI